MKEPVYYFNTCDSFIKNGGGNEFYNYLNGLISLAGLAPSKDSIPNSKTAEKLYC
ncbi:MAG: hypothetical protein LUD77_11085 [Clostridiales bacterium]|nr:hypothetical protein [Clostridiales bacterium]